MEQRPKKLLNKSARPSGSSTIPSATRSPASTGSHVTFCSTTSATPMKWVSQRSRPFSPTWLWINTWPPLRKTPCTERSRSEALSALLFLYREVLRKDLDGPLMPCAPKETRPGASRRWQRCSLLCWASALHLSLRWNPLSLWKGCRPHPAQPEGKVWLSSPRAAGRRS